MTRMVFGGPIYPVPLKPKSNIDRWGTWPEDIEFVLRAWNGSGAQRNKFGGHQLSFYRGPIFKCLDCATFCESHHHGAARLDGDALCDDCLIARAREFLDRIVVGSEADRP